ncbi:hypothetical protein NIASO_02605 [Niabella soli DSM 19437]|uniref:Uncharacterized protein n=1 Tax=Niabella soli DSM 19437 TaxID=929713 RepID=W0F6T1_9BACT|nr:hypothetical protein NIASO_02605 [Niabella soli DSM 19437]
MIFFKNCRDVAVANNSLLFETNIPFFKTNAIDYIKQVLFYFLTDFPDLHRFFYFPLYRSVNDSNNDLGIKITTMDLPMLLHRNQSRQRAH